MAVVDTKPVFEGSIFPGLVHRSYRELQLSVAASSTTLHCVNTFASADSLIDLDLMSIFRTRIGHYVLLTSNLFIKLRYLHGRGLFIRGQPAHCRVKLIHCTLNLNLILI